MKTNKQIITNYYRSLILAIAIALGFLASCSHDSTSSNEIPITGILNYSNLLIKEGVASGTTPTWTSNNTSQVITYSITRISNGTNIAVPPSITIDSTTGKVTVTDTAKVADSGVYKVIGVGGSKEYHKKHHKKNRKKDKGRKKRKHRENYHGSRGAPFVIAISSATAASLTGTLSYSAINVNVGTQGTSNPTRAGHNAAETVLYSLKKPGNNVPSSISIHQTTGVVTVSTNAVATDSGIYAVLVTGIGSFKDNQRADIDIKVTKP